MEILIIGCWVGLTLCWPISMHFVWRILQMLLFLYCTPRLLPQERKFCGYVLDHIHMAVYLWASKSKEQVEEALIVVIFNNLLTMWFNVWFWHRDSKATHQVICHQQSKIHWYYDAWENPYPTWVLLQYWRYVALGMRRKQTLQTNVSRQYWLCF